MLGPHHVQVGIRWECGNNWGDLRIKHGPQLRVHGRPKRVGANQIRPHEGVLRTDVKTERRAPTHPARRIEAG